jgi:capsular polysaccharide biosynthesis protein
MKVSNSDIEREFDIRELLQVIINKIWMILFVGACSGIIIFLISYFVIDWKYEATTQIYILNNQDNGSQVTYTDMEISRYLIEDYKTLATSRLVTEQVIAKLKLDMKYEELVKLIHIENPADTRVLIIKAEYKDPKIAKQLADAIRDATNGLFFSLTAENHVTKILDANIPEEPSAPDVKRNTLLAGILGAMISAFVILLHYLSDNTIKNSYDIEKILDLKVLSIIRLQKYKAFLKKILRKLQNKKLT